MNQPHALDEKPYRATCSLGATFGQQTQSAAELLKQADIATYQVKARHGNALCFFDPRCRPPSMSGHSSKWICVRHWNAANSNCTTSPNSRWMGAW
ncbi:diguanylate cyclase domain-containing protein [Candidatus Aalborgicola defluviihabitans]|uniref:diguanylate cyclase domain-containing protein n=1 Tax=Candidatus Aalborgicola defluviihabitans TaxID=3386187 RepID=UPI0039B8A3B2